MMKLATCPKNEEHHLFRRKVEVRAETWLLLDQSTAPLDIEQPQTYSWSRNISSELLCAQCGAKARVRLPF